MPRQNTCPADFPPFILAQITQMAQHIVATRKARGETQMQWAERLGISQPTMARLERGDPAIATATYVMCLWLVNPALNLLQLLAPSAAAATPPLAAPPLAAPPEAMADATIRPTVSAATGPALSRHVADEFAALLGSFPAPRPARS